MGLETEPSPQLSGSQEEIVFPLNPAKEIERKITDAKFGEILVLSQ